MALTRVTSTGISDGAITVADITDNTITGAKLTSDIAISTTSNITAGSLIAGAAIDLKVVSGGNATSNGSNIVFYGGSHATDPNVLKFRYGTTETMRIASNGRVGIGTSSPERTLHLQSAAPEIMMKDSDDNSYNTILSNGGVLSISTSAAGTLKVEPLGASAVQLASDTSLGFNIGSNYNYEFDVNGTEVMRINGTTNNVGIGTISPDAKLEVLGEGTSGTTTISASNGIVNSGNYHDFTVAGNNTEYAVGIRRYLSQSTPSYLNPELHFFVQNNNTYLPADRVVRMKIISNGDIFFSNTTETAINGGSTDGKMIDNADGGRLRSSRASTSTREHIIFYNPNGDVGDISTSGTSTSYNTSSDYRLKENVVDMTGATTRLKQLSPKRFNFIADADTTVDGFLAHEVSDIVPEAITGTKDEVDADGNPVYQGIDQSKLVPLLVATIKELEARITALENA